MKIDERMLKHLKNLYKSEKGLGACVSDEEFAVNTLNLLLLHTEQPDLIDTIVGLFMVIDRLGLEDYCCVTVERFLDGKLRAMLRFQEFEEEEDVPEC